MIDEIGGDFLQWLRGFYYVAQKKNVTLAAQEIGRNQPAVSHQIKRLEDEFGIALFDRSRGKMQLTSEGRALLDKAISIFEIIREMQGITHSHLHDHYQISIASTHAIIQCYLPRYLQAFRKEFPNITFNLMGGGLTEIMEKVESAEVDFGIASLHSVPSSIDYIVLFETQLKFITAKNSCFHLGNAPTLEQIAKLPFIAQPLTATRAPLIARRFADDNLELNTVLTVNHFESIKRYVELGLGVSMMEDFVIFADDIDKLDVYSLQNYFNRNSYGIVMRKRKYISPAARAFLRSVKANIEINQSGSKNST